MTIGYYSNHAGPPAYLNRHPVLRSLAAVGWLLAGPAMLGLIAWGVWAGFSRATAFFSPMLTLLILIAIAMMARNARRARAMIAVNYVEQAVRLNLPIPAMLTAARDAERGALRRRLTRLRDRLEQGLPVGVALRRSIPGVPARVLGLVSAAERVGQLPRTLARLVAQDEPVIDRSPMQSILLRWYPILMLMCVSPLFGFLAIYVMPKLKNLFSDFHLKLPQPTAWLFEFWDVMQVPITAFAALAFVALSGRMLAEAMPQRRTHLSLFRGLTDRVAWLLPPWRSLVRHRGLADACHVLADAVEAGQPIDRAIAEAAEACTNLVLQKRVSQWSAGVTSGLPLADAARDAGLPRLVVGLLRTARGDDIGGVFDFLARYYESRFSTALAVLQGAAVPIMVVVLAAFVTTVALGLFLPLTELINHLATPKGVM